MGTRDVGSDGQSQNFKSDGVLQKQGFATVRILGETQIAA